jgi:hypothetical protein
MNDFDGGMEMIDPVPLSDEDRSDWGGGVTYVGPDGPENRSVASAVVIPLADRRRRIGAAVSRPTTEAPVIDDRKAA